ncbi:hypothetical protein TNCV_2770651 [Trichonephila clavipes]|nr:hypothetical protein TNCV_2770651 [Trichonephila clavipes]
MLQIENFSVSNLVECVGIPNVSVLKLVNASNPAPFRETKRISCVHDRRFESKFLASAKNYLFQARSVEAYHQLPLEEEFIKNHHPILTLRVSPDVLWIVKVSTDSSATS